MYVTQSMEIRSDDTYLFTTSFYSVTTLKCYFNLILQRNLGPGSHRVEYHVTSPNFAYVPIPNYRPDYLQYQGTHWISSDLWTNLDNRAFKTKSSFKARLSGITALTKLV